MLRPVDDDEVTPLTSTDYRHIRYEWKDLMCALKLIENWRFNLAHEAETKIRNQRRLKKEKRNG